MAKPNLGALLGQVQKMQEKMEKAQEGLVDIEVEGTAGGGMVTVIANAKQEIQKITIDPEVVDPEDIDMLEDLIVAATNQALEKAQQASSEHMQKEAGGMMPNLPPGLKIPGF
jgi:DNA-binding YbaB/EbfC family protein